MHPKGATHPKGVHVTSRDDQHRRVLILASKVCTHLHACPFGGMHTHVHACACSRARMCTHACARIKRNVMHTPKGCAYACTPLGCMHSRNVTAYTLRVYAYTPRRGVFKSRETEGRPSDTKKKRRDVMHAPSGHAYMHPEGVHVHVTFVS